MNNLQEIFFVVLAVSLAVGMLASTILFNALKREYPQYYKLIGEPRIIYNGFSATDSGGSQVFKAQRYILLLVGKGVPSNFPKDHGLRTLTVLIRYLFIWMFVVFLILIALSFMPQGGF